MRSRKGFRSPKVKFGHLQVKCDHKDPRLTTTTLKSAYILETQFLFKNPHCPKILLLHSTAPSLLAVLSSSKPVSSSGVTKTQKRGVRPPLLPNSSDLTCIITHNTSKSLKKEWWPLLPLKIQPQRSLSATSQAVVKRVSGGSCSGSPKLHL